MHVGYWPLHYLGMVLTQLLLFIYYSPFILLGQILVIWDAPLLVSAVCRGFTYSTVGASARKPKKRGGTKENGVVRRERGVTEKRGRKQSGRFSQVMCIWRPHVIRIYCDLVVFCMCLMIVLLRFILNEVCHWAPLVATRQENEAPQIR